MSTAARNPFYFSSSLPSYLSKSAFTPFSALLPPHLSLRYGSALATPSSSLLGLPFNLPPALLNSLSSVASGRAANPYAAFTYGLLPFVKDGSAVSSPPNVTTI
jgi:hypothetical protein